MRRWRIAAGGAAVAMVGLSVSGCGSEARAVCGVVVDSTTYAKPATSRSDVSSKLPPFADGCDWIGFAAVTGASEGSSCRVDPVAIAATKQENPNDNPVVEDRIRKFRVTEALPRAVKLFDCPREGAGSDVLGALRYLVKQMTAVRTPDRPHRLLVFSDLINNQGLLDISRLDLSENARARKIQELRAAHLLPDLTAYPLTVCRFLRQKTSAPDRFPLLESFWREALEASGATTIDLL